MQYNYKRIILYSFPYGFIYKARSESFVLALLDHFTFIIVITMSQQFMINILCQSYTIFFYFEFYGLPDSIKTKV
jgi:hypothetical protein